MAAGVAYKCDVLTTRPALPPRLSVLSWNVLARPYTIYNSQAHRAATRVEDPTQTYARYTMAGKELLNRSADVVMLQECEAAFFDVAWNAAAENLMEKYFVMPCRIGDEPGTAVLVRKEGPATALDPKPICVGGDASTGGVSKVATVARLKVSGAPADVTVVSTHFMWDGGAEKRAHHCHLVGKAIEGQDVIIGGDFNCDKGAPLDKLEKTTFFGELRRAELGPGDAMTGLSGDLTQEKCIDHIYASPGLVPLQPMALAWPKSPWSGEFSGPANVSGASDHVPIFSEFEFIAQAKL